MFLTSILCFNFNLRFPLPHSRSHTNTCPQYASIPHNTTVSSRTPWTAYETKFLRTACTSWNNNSGKLLPPLFGSCIEPDSAWNSRQLLTEHISDDTRQHHIIFCTWSSYLDFFFNKPFSKATARSSTLHTCIQFNYVFLDFLEFKCLGHAPHVMG